MPHKQLDRKALRIRPLSERRNRVFAATDMVPVDAKPRGLSRAARLLVDETVERVVAAKKNGRPVMLTFGAHTIKNGLGPLLIKLMDDGWVTHLATNGAGVIHDWELAYQGETGEDVKENVDAGRFGIWEETGRYINLAIGVGAYLGMGYGESVGAMIEQECLNLPESGTLRQEITANLESDPACSAAASDLLTIMTGLNVRPGRHEIPHKFKHLSVQAAAFRLGIPFFGLPMIGHDIIYTHPLNSGAAIGRTGLRDFLAFAEGVNRLDGGAYISIGSAVMSPMIFEKALSMCQNLHIAKGEHINDLWTAVIDLAPAGKGWSSGSEPASSDPSYYRRYLKTFNRMGGTTRYARADNRDFLLGLYGKLRKPIRPGAEPDGKAG